jgi:hypothetical protein
LNLYGNPIGSLDAITAAFEANRGIKALNLTKTGVTDEMLAGFLPHLGVHPFPEDQISDHQKREKERDRVITKNAKANVKELVPVVDAIFQNEEGAWFINKNEIFTRLNLSQNSFSEAKNNLKQLLENSLENFKVVLWGTQCPNTFLKKYGEKIAQ